MSRLYYTIHESSPPVVAYVEEGQQPEGYELITDDDLLRIWIDKTYLKKERDGLEYYRFFRAGLIIEVQKGLISMNDALWISKKFKIVSQDLKSGDWIEAQADADLIIADLVCDQQRIDQVKSDIQNYINANY